MSLSENFDSRSYQELLLKEKYLEVINAFAVSLIEAETINDVLKAVTHQAIANLNYYDCVVYLYDDKKKTLIQRAAYGPKSLGDDSVYNPINIKPGTGIVGSVYSTGKAEIVNDTRLDPRYIVDDEPRLSEISVPLVHKGQVIGVLDSEHPLPNFFSDQDLKMLTTVAAMISTKIGQAKSNEQVKKYQINLEKLVQRKTRQLEETNKDLLTKNKEKEILIKEIHHRVKNNMQIIISLLNMQSNLSILPEQQLIYDDLKTRIRSMALIHERLYLEKEISKISIDEYSRELINDLILTYSHSHQVQFKINMQPLQMSIDNAIPFGLMLNELVTNSCKHAFKNKKVTIEVSSKISGNMLHLFVKDDGQGFEFEKVQRTSFGLELISILVDQLNGSIHHNGSDGSNYHIQIPIDGI